MAKGREQRRLAVRQSEADGLPYRNTPWILNGDGTLGVDAQKLEAPTNVYVAHVADVAVRHEAVSLFFGQLDDEKAGGLSTKLELRYPFEYFLNHFWKNSREFHARLRVNTATMPNVDDSGKQTEIVAVKATQKVVLSVNYEFIVQSGTEAALDFFHIPPTAIYLWNQTRDLSKMELQPKVRVQTSAFELLRLLDRSADIAARIAAKSEASKVGGV